MCELYELLECCRKREREITRRRVKRRRSRNAVRPAYGIDRPTRKIERKVVSRPQSGRRFSALSRTAETRRAVALQFSRVWNSSAWNLSSTSPFFRSNGHGRSGSWNVALQLDQAIWKAPRTWTITLFFSCKTSRSTGALWETRVSRVPGMWDTIDELLNSCNDLLISTKRRHALGYALEDWSI